MSDSPDGRDVLELLDHRQVYEMTCKAIEDYCTARRMDFSRHSSHGLYYDVYYPSKYRGARFMLDAAVDDYDDPRRRERGYIVVRPGSHYYDNPRRLGALNILADEDSTRQLDILLGVDNGA